MTCQRGWTCQPSWTSSPPPVRWTAGRPDRRPVGDNLTPDTATAPILKAPTTWESFQGTLKADDGERHPFYPLRDIPSGSTVHLKVVGGPFFEDFHGQYSLVELDVRDGDKKLFRLCVSGQRLAAAMASVRASVGDTLALTPTGDGKDRTWSVRRL